MHEAATCVKIRRRRHRAIELEHEYYGTPLALREGTPELLFTENETNTQRLYGDEKEPAPM